MKDETVQRLSGVATLFTEAFVIIADVGLGRVYCSFRGRAWCKQCM